MRKDYGHSYRSMDWYSHCREPDVILASSNKAYHTVSQTGGRTTDYEAVSEPDTSPPEPSTSQPPTAGEYEQV